MTEWTNERVEKLKKMWGEGLSASQIAAQLGGVSRNAVIGKAHRINLPPRTRGARSPAAPRAPRVSKAPSNGAVVRLPRGGAMSSLVRPPLLQNRAVPSAPAKKKEEPPPTFTCRGVSLAELEEGQCDQYLMPGDDGYQQGAARYCGNPLPEKRHKLCAGHVDRMKTSRVGVIGRFTDHLDRGLSRLCIDA